MRVLHRLNAGWERTGALDLVDKGGTLAADGMLFVNGASWAHVAAGAVRVLRLPRKKALDADTLDGRRPGEGVVF